MNPVHNHLHRIIAVCRELSEVNQAVQNTNGNKLTKVTLNFPDAYDSKRFSDVDVSAGTMSGEVLRRALRSRGEDLIHELESLGVDIDFLDNSYINQED